MKMKIAMVVGAFVLLFLGYVLTRPSSFRYERSGKIQAPTEAIFPYLSDLKKGAEWSPYEKMDPNMKKSFTGPDGQVGAAEDFESKEAGSGRLEMTKIVPNERVEIKLTMTSPFPSENLVTYTLAPEDGATKFTWSMSGENGFLGKLLSVFIDCDKLIGGQFEDGIAALKTLVEKRG